MKFLIHKKHPCCENKNKPEHALNVSLYARILFKSSFHIFVPHCSCACWLVYYDTNSGINLPEAFVKHKTRSEYTKSSIQQSGQRTALSFPIWSRRLSWVVNMAPQWFQILLWIHILSGHESLTFLTLSLQTCNDELHGSSCGAVKLEVLRQLTKLLRLAVDMVRGPASSHFTALSAINHIVDICVTHGVHHPWRLEDSGQPPGLGPSTPSPLEPSLHPCAQHGLHVSSSREGLMPSSISGSGFAQHSSGATASGISSSHSHSGLPTSCTKSSMMSSVLSDVNNPVHVQIENLIRGSPRFPGRCGIGSSPGKLRNASWRSSSGRNQQDSMKSNRSVGESSLRETSFMGGLSEESDVSLTVGVATDSNAILERTPLELLFNSDPGPLIKLLCSAIEKHKSTMGTRHKCTPSVRLRHCTYHCLQIMSARALTVISHRCEFLRLVPTLSDPET